MRALSFGLFLYFIGSPFLMRAQDDSLRNSSSWKIYLATKAQKQLGMDSLNNLPSGNLNMDSVKFFLSTTTKLPRDQWSVWMGEYICTARLQDDTPRKLIVSVFGGFFLDPKTMTYYTVSDNVKQRWTAFFHESYALLIKSKDQ